VSHSALDFLLHLFLVPLLPLNVIYLGKVPFEVGLFLNGNFAILRFGFVDNRLCGVNQLVGFGPQ